jgi:hypothetical protein
MADPDDAALARHREDIGAALKHGLATDWKARAYEDADVRRVVAALQALPADALERKLRTAGFTLEPYVHPEAPEIEQSCSTCMYYEPHRRYCNLPELKLGVEPEWSCILWRI